MPSVAARKPRPKYLSLRALLLEIRLPLPGKVSILHRVSGTILVFPFAAWLLYLLDASLASEAGFARVQAYLQLPLVKLGALLFVWAYCHHFCAGIRFLLLDLNKGITLEATRRSALVVMIVSLALTAWFGAKLW